jgi:small-conductance mechanosensitive channel
MPFNLSDWLFDAGMGPDGGLEDFRYFFPFLIVCGVGLLIWFYYWVEGRKRFIKKGNYPLKDMLDRYLNWLAVICFVGIPIALSRVALQGFFFAWRFWRILWVVALLVWAVLWIIYFVRVYPEKKAQKVWLDKQREYENKGKNNKNKK